MENFSEKEQIIKYLFGELVENEREKFEERLFFDENFGLSVEDTENDLIDEYVRNEFDVNFRNKFEEKYLISENRRQKIQVAATLSQQVFSSATQNVSPIEEQKVLFWEAIKSFFKTPQLVYLCSLLMLLTAGIFSVWYFVSKGNDQNDIAAANSQPTVSKSKTPEKSQNVNSNEANLPISENKSNVNSNKIEPKNANKVGSQNVKPTPEETKKPIQSLPKENLPSDVKDKETRSLPFFATLLPSLRDDAGKSPSISSKHSSIVLKVVHNNEKMFEKYQVEVRNPDGDLISSKVVQVNAKNLKSSIRLNLPNKQLKKGNYEISLIGVSKDEPSEPIGFYNFTIK